MNYNQKLALGFDTDNESITIFKGNKENLEDWFKESNARYSTLWGWYIIGSEEIPNPLPYGLIPIKLDWISVGKEDNTLKPEYEVKKAVGNLMYDATPSKFIGEIKQRLNLVLKLVKAVTIEGKYGSSFFYLFKDKDENEFIWITQAKQLTENTTYAMRGTVKEHRINRNSKQTVLTRCSIISEM